MDAFILRMFKGTLTPRLVGLTIFAIAFAWFLANPEMDPLTIFSSIRLAGVYDLMVSWVVVPAYLLSVIEATRAVLKRGVRELLFTRLSPHQVLWGIVFSSLLVFAIGTVLPTYTMAALQQSLYAPKSIHFSVFLVRLLSPITGSMLFWTVGAILCAVRFRNEFVAFLIAVFVYGLTRVVSLFTQGLVFDQYWLLDEGGSLSWHQGGEALFLWIVTMGLAFLGLMLTARRVAAIDLLEKYDGGVLAKIAAILHLDLTVQHIRMIGQSGLKLLTFFSSLGLVLVIAVARQPNMHLFVLVKIYLGALIPIVFSFNQFSLLKIDRDAGMVHNNFLRQLSYPLIVGNRWLCILMPQLFVSVCFMVASYAFLGDLPVSFFLYLLLLHVLCSSFNLFVAVVSMNNAAANIALALLVYVQLRDDVQLWIAAHPALMPINIFSVLVQESEHLALPSHWLIAAFLSVAFLVMSGARLRRVQYVRLAMD